MSRPLLLLDVQQQLVDPDDVVHVAGERRAEDGGDADGVLVEVGRHVIRADRVLALLQRDDPRLHVEVAAELLPHHVDVTTEHEVGPVDGRARPPPGAAFHFHFRDSAPSMIASDEPWVRQPVVSPGAWKRSASIRTQRCSISAEIGYSAWSMKLRCRFSAMIRCASGSIQVVTKVARLRSGRLPGQVLADQPHRVGRTASRSRGTRRRDRLGQEPVAEQCRGLCVPLPGSCSWVESQPPGRWGDPRAASGAAADRRHPRPLPSPCASRCPCPRLGRDGGERRPDRFQ